MLQLCFSALSWLAQHGDTGDREPQVGCDAPDGELVGTATSEQGRPVGLHAHCHTLGGQIASSPAPGESTGCCHGLWVTVVAGPHFWTGSGPSRLPLAVQWLTLLSCSWASKDAAAERSSLPGAPVTARGYGLYSGHINTESCVSQFPCDLAVGTC